MSIKELKEKNQKELHAELAKQREILRDLRFEVSQRQLKNVREIRKIRKTINQILTLLNTKK